MIRFKCCIAITSLFILFAWCHPVEAWLQSNKYFQSGVFDKSIQVGENLRNYIVYVPQGIATSAKPAAVFYFHGSVGDENFYQSILNNLRKFRALADSEKFILVIPKGILAIGRYHWADGEASLAFFDVLLKFLKNAYSLDPGRIYITGMSSGAIFSFLLACLRPLEIAAAVPVSGNYYLEHKKTGQLNCPITDTPVAIRDYHGTEDTIPHDHVRDKVVGRWATLLNGCEAIPNGPVAVEPLYPPYYSEKEGGYTAIWELTQWLNCANGADVEFVSMVNRGHFTSDKASPEIWNFMKSHPKKCGIVTVTTSSTCHDFRNQRQGKTPEYLARCGSDQVKKFREELSLTTPSQWSDFLSPCKSSNPQKAN